VPIVAENQSRDAFIKITLQRVSLELLLSLASPDRCANESVFPFRGRSNADDAISFACNETEVLDCNVLVSTPRVPLLKLHRVQREVKYKSLFAGHLFTLQVVAWLKKYRPCYFT